ncbi:MAG: hypothetical protein L0Y68_02190 [Candidatus Dadabacteria bacterium]|nr:hypothetical protein [Candidatus Dadabacteria bacterium]
MKRFAYSLFFTVALISGLSLCYVEPAFSIPTNQQDCSGGVALARLHLNSFQTWK